MDNKKAVEEVRNRLFETTVLVKFKIALNEVGFSEARPPFFLKVALNTYMWFLQPKIEAFFFEHKAKHTDKGPTFWLSIAEQPLPFNWHFGTILDVFFPPQTPQTSHTIPLIPEIEVHFRNYPSEFPRFHGHTHVEELVMHNIKENVWVRTGKKELIRMNLMPEETSMIFKCLGEQKFGQIETILKPFRGFYKNHQLKVKLFIRPLMTSVSRLATIGHSLDHFLADNFPELFQSDMDTPTLKDGFSDFKVTCCGVVVDRSAKVEELDELLAFFDLAFVLVVHY